MTHPIEQYEQLVKGTIIAAFTSQFLGQLPADEFVASLSRMFRWKQKQFHHIALYVQREVEGRGRDLGKTLRNVSFFAGVLHEFQWKTNNQPTKDVL